jgi:hypothetical protein
LGGREIDRALGEQAEQGIAAMVREGMDREVDQVATTWIAPGWSARPDAVGNLLLVREDGGGQAEPLPSIRSQRS